jgi:predicted Rossmann-fold nucleotide-binding protein
MAQVFVSGTWRAERALPFSQDAEEFGASLARRGFDLAVGPGTGIARHVIDGYRRIEPRGNVSYYLPRAELMAEVGESVELGYDVIHQTDFDYPTRNVWQISRCDGLAIITGGDGALEEALPALVDYRLPVALVRNSGPAAIAIERLLDLFPEWNDLLIVGDSIHDVSKEFFNAVESRVENIARAIRI